MTQYVTPLHVSRDGLFGIPGRSFREDIVLAAGTSQLISVPTTSGGILATDVIFAATADIYARYYATGEDADIMVQGNFTTTTSWTPGAGWVLTTVATATTASSDLSVTLPLLIPGQAYSVVFDATRSAGSVVVNVGGTAGTSRSSSATFTETIVAGSTGILKFTGTGFSGTIDNVTVTAVQAVPTANNLLGSGADLNPTTRGLLGVNKIGLISASACNVTLTFFTQ